jgi:hypothetical protein
MAEPLSAKQAAIALETDARTLRKFLRKRNGLVGQGYRWLIDPDDIEQLKLEFKLWQSRSMEIQTIDGNDEPD